MGFASGPVGVPEQPIGTNSIRRVWCCLCCCRAKRKNNSNSPVESVPESEFNCFVFFSFDSSN